MRVPPPRKEKVPVDCLAEPERKEISRSLQQNGFKEIGRGGRLCSDRVISIEKGHDTSEDGSKGHLRQPQPGAGS